MTSSPNRNSNFFTKSNLILRHKVLESKIRRIHLLCFREEAANTAKKIRQFRISVYVHIIRHFFSMQTSFISFFMFMTAMNRKVKRPSGPAVGLLAVSYSYGKIRGYLFCAWVSQTGVFIFPPLSHAFFRWLSGDQRRISLDSNVFRSPHYWPFLWNSCLSMADIFFLGIMHSTIFFLLLPLLMK